MSEEVGIPLDVTRETIPRRKSPLSLLCKNKRNASRIFYSTTILAQSKSNLKKAKPSQIDISGNEKKDQAAKRALSLGPDAADILPLNKEHVRSERRCDKSKHILFCVQHNLKKR